VREQRGRSVVVFSNYGFTGCLDGSPITKQHVSLYYDPHRYIHPRLLCWRLWCDGRRVGAIAWADDTEMFSLHPVKLAVGCSVLERYLTQTPAGGNSYSVQDVRRVVVSTAVDLPRV